MSGQILIIDWKKQTHRIVDIGNPSQAAAQFMREIDKVLDCAYYCKVEAPEVPDQDEIPNWTYETKGGAVPTSIRILTSKGTPHMTIENI